MQASFLDWAYAECERRLFDGRAVLDGRSCGYLDLIDLDHHPRKIDRIGGLPCIAKPPTIQVQSEKIAGWDPSQLDQCSKRQFIYPTGNFTEGDRMMKLEPPRGFVEGVRIAPLCVNRVEMSLFICELGIDQHCTRRGNCVQSSEIASVNFHENLDKGTRARTGHILDLHIDGIIRQRMRRKGRAWRGGVNQGVHISGKGSVFPEPDLELGAIELPLPMHVAPGEEMESILLSFFICQRGFEF